MGHFYLYISYLAMCFKITRPGTLFNPRPRFKIVYAAENSERYYHVSLTQGTFLLTACPKC